MLDPLLVRLGVLSTAQLASIGWSKHARDVATSRGVLVPVRRGWFARPDADERVAAAVRAGGCVSCATALRLHGAWVPSSLDGNHLRRAAHHRGPSSLAWCRPHGDVPPVVAAVDDVDVAFRCLLRCGTAEDIVVVADSLLHLRRATPSDLDRWATVAPRRIRAILTRVDVAESGLESVVRLRLRSRGVTVRTQVWIGARRVDLLVGELLVIECDGAEHHASWDAHAADRARDRALTAQGYLVVRVTYRQILDDWPSVERDLLAIIRRGAHRAPKRQHET